VLLFKVPKTPLGTADCGETIDETAVGAVRHFWDVGFKMRTRVEAVAARYEARLCSGQENLAMIFLLICCESYNPTSLFSGI
jgi:hypothetical protein